MEQKGNNNVQKFAENFAEASIVDNESQINILLVDGETQLRLSGFLILVILVRCVFIKIGSPLMSQS